MRVWWSFLGIAPEFVPADVLAIDTVQGNYVGSAAAVDSGEVYNVVACRGGQLNGTPVRSHGSARTRPSAKVAIPFASPT